jgi:hypothetical protein
MPKSNTRKLNDTQLVILSSASQREDGFAVLPEGVRAASVKAAVIRLTKLGFLKQVRVKRDQPHWSSDEEGRRIGLKITTAGSAAIGVGAEISAWAISVEASPIKDCSSSAAIARPAEPLATLAVGSSAAAAASRASGEVFGSGTGTGVCGNHGPAAAAGSARGTRGGAGCFGAPH